MNDYENEELNNLKDTYKDEKVESSKEILGGILLVVMSILKMLIAIVKAIIIFFIRLATGFRS